MTQECPLCITPLDQSELLSFFPCPCHYQICAFCYNKIRSETDQCPGCRQHYTGENYPPRTWQSTTTTTGRVLISPRVITSPRLHRVTPPPPPPPRLPIQPTFNRRSIESNSRSAPRTTAILTTARSSTATVRESVLVTYTDNERQLGHCYVLLKPEMSTKKQSNVEVQGVVRRYKQAVREGSLAPAQAAEAILQQLKQRQNAPIPTINSGPSSSVISYPSTRVVGGPSVAVAAPVFQGAWAQLGQLKVG